MDTWVGLYPGLQVSVSTDLSADTSAPPRPECASHFWVAYLPFLGYRRMHVYNINEPSYDYIVYPM